ncbi:MAG: hypothetical protein WKF75_21400 [Singulisphaera sp.]
MMCFSLGATLYELLTGSRPSTTAKSSTCVQGPAGSSRCRATHRAVPAALEAVCLKAMAFPPEDRYPSASALAGDIERWLAGEPVSAWREPFPTRARRWLRRHRPWLTAGRRGRGGPVRPGHDRLPAELGQPRPAYWLSASSRRANRPRLGSPWRLRRSRRSTPGRARTCS